VKHSLIAQKKRQPNTLLLQCPSLVPFWSDVTGIPSAEKVMVFFYSALQSSLLVTITGVGGGRRAGVVSSIKIEKRTGTYCIPGGKSGFLKKKILQH
jgi:hypothetical protein